MVVYSVLDLPKAEDSHWKEKLRRIDFLGAFSLVIAVFCLLVGLDRGSNVSWSGIIAIVFTSVSIPLFALFIFIEMKVASNPFAPGHVIFERSLFASYLSNFFASAANTGFLFYLPLYFQAVDGLSAVGSGLRLSKCSLCQGKGRALLMENLRCSPSGCGFCPWLSIWWKMDAEDRKVRNILRAKAFFSRYLMRASSFGTCLEGIAPPKHCCLTSF